MDDLFKDLFKHYKATTGVGGGIFYVLLGLFIYLWASRHSPHMGFGEMLIKEAQDPNYYILKEPVYSVIIVVAVGLVLVGIVQLVRELVLSAKE